MAKTERDMNDALDLLIDSMRNLDGRPAQNPQEAMHIFRLGICITVLAWALGRAEGNDFTKMLVGLRRQVRPHPRPALHIVGKEGTNPNGN